LRAFNIWSAIKKMVIWDINEDLLLDILVSAEDGYIYQIWSSRINPPSYVKDWMVSWTDIVSQSNTKEVWLNFPSVEWSNWYVVQLYNFTSKSIVFDWIDIWNSTSKCIISSDYTNSNCISSWKYFSLNKNDVYQWRVQSYNSTIFSPIAVSNWFFIE